MARQFVDRVVLAQARLPDHAGLCLSAILASMISLISPGTASWDTMADTLPDVSDGTNVVRAGRSRRPSKAVPPGGVGSADSPERTRAHLPRDGRLECLKARHVPEAREQSLMTSSGRATLTTAALSAALHGDLPACRRPWAPFFASLVAGSVSSQHGAATAAPLALIHGVRCVFGWSGADPDPLGHTPGNFDDDGALEPSADRRDASGPPKGVKPGWSRWSS